MRSDTQQRTDESRPGGQAEPAGRAPARRRRRPWYGLLAFVVLVYLALFVAPAYLTLDPALAQVPISQSVDVHYPLVIAHVLSGTVAMLTGLVQVAPRLRRRYPRLHRVSGRIYVAAVLLGVPAIGGLVVIRTQELDGATTSNVVGFGLLAILWFLTTVGAFQAARQGRFADHRRLMIYSFALTVSIIWSRVAFGIGMAIPGFDLRWVQDNTGWLPWVINLLVVQWWLNRTAKRPLDLPATART